MSKSLKKIFTDKYTRTNIDLLLLASVVLYNHNIPSLEYKLDKNKPVYTSKKSKNINKVGSNNKVKKKNNTNEKGIKKKKILSTKNNNIYAKVYLKRCRKYIHHSKSVL